ncbi:Fc.00g006780.m01.CDS01 [Cosmosporella sp. VM-42]
MAKSSRSSSKKANNQRKAASLYGPVEAARAERLSARLLELAKQPKPEHSNVNIDAQNTDAKTNEAEKSQDDGTTMEVDLVKPTRARIEKKRIDKRRVKKSGIVFKKHSDRQAAKRKKATTT